jgi:hypothetical protein
MEKILVEGIHHTGAVVKSPKRAVKAHQSRSYVGMGTLPYDWTKPLTTGYTQPIKNQDQAGKCGGEMIAQMIQMYRTLVLGKPFQELSADSFYSQGYAIGGGMTMQAVSDGVAYKGITTTANVPDPLPCSELQARDTSWRTAPMIQDCLMRAGLQIVSVSRNIDLMAQALRDNKQLGMMIGGQNNGSWLSSRPIPPVSNYGLWMHYMAFSPDISAMTTEKLLTAYQSWGINVGRNGMQDFGENYISSGYIYDAFTLTKKLFLKDLKLGSFGTDVKYLQARLGMPMDTFGFGIFGLKTKAAVIAYQKANNITPAVGYCGQITRASLNK